MRHGSKIAPQRPPSWKSLRCHISAVNDPILVKCGMLTQNDMTITAIRSKSKLNKCVSRTDTNPPFVGRHCPYTYTIWCGCVHALLRYRSKTTKMQKFPTDSYSNENFISPSPRAANSQKGSRHIRSQSTPACKLSRESTRRLSRNRWPNKKKQKKQVRQQDAYHAIRPAYSRGCCPRAAKGDKTYLQPVFLQLIFGVDLLTFRPDIAYKRRNCEK